MSNVFSRQFMGFAVVAAFTLAGAMPQQFSRGEMVGGLVNCDSNGSHHQYCDAVAGQTCVQTVRRCRAKNGDALTLVCTAAAGDPICANAFCVGTNHDILDDNCVEIAP